MRLSLLSALCAISIPFVSATIDDSQETNLKIEKVNQVDCSRPSQKGDRLKVHYHGALLDGTKFDASYDRNQPFDFVVGQGSVIKGWDVGMVGMCPGEKRKLTVEPLWGYGIRRMGPIPPDSTLVFDVELLEIVGQPKQEL